MIDIAYEWFPTPGKHVSRDYEELNLLMKQLSTKATAIPVEITKQHGDYMRWVVARDSVMQHDRSIIGMAILLLLPLPSGKKAFIEDVVVDERYRGKGISKHMMKMLMEEARQSGVTKIRLTSKPKRREAHGLYLSLGFTIVDTCVFDYVFADHKEG